MMTYTLEDVQIQMNTTAVANWYIYAVKNLTFSPLFQNIHTCICQDDFCNSDFDSAGDGNTSQPEEKMKVIMNISKPLYFPLF